MTTSHDEQEQMARWRRMNEYELSPEEERMRDSISNCLYFGARLEDVVEWKFTRLS